MIRTPDRARLALGLVLLLRPDLPAKLTLTHPRSTPPDRRGPVRTRRVCQVLGARYVAQALGGSLLRRDWMPAADAAVDLVHAASMTWVAVRSPGYRRLATTSAVTALGFAMADLHAPERSERSGPAAAGRVPGTARP